MKQLGKTPSMLHQASSVYAYRWRHFSMLCLTDLLDSYWIISTRIKIVSILFWLLGNTKYGVPSNRPPAVSSFLQKRLQKGQKFFDSGDYNMAKSMKSSKPHITAGAPNPSATVKRNLPLLLPPGPEENPLPVLTPEDLPHHSHPAHEPSKLVTDQIQAPTSSA